LVANKLGTWQVIGHKGSIHLVQIKAGVSRAFQLGQGRHMKLHTCNVLPMQLDSEPWLQVNTIMCFAFLVGSYV